MSHVGTRKIKRGSSLLELIIYGSMSIIIVVALVLVMQNLMRLNKFIESSNGYTKNVILLDSAILTDLKTGGNTVSYIDDTASKGFILNGNYFDFSSTKPIDYSELGVTSTINSNYLTITTTLNSAAETRKYNINFW